METAIIIWLICTGLGWALNGTTGAMLGLFFGPIGVAVALYMAGRDG